jgi:hypothetical protein
MNQFEISFFFDHHHHPATVTVIHGKHHIQYTVGPTDEDLLIRYGTQVIHQFKGKPMELAFPGDSPEKIAFSKAILTSLEHYLETATKP